MRALLPVAALVAVLGACPSCSKREPTTAGPRTVMVAAAASLRELASETAALFESAHPGTTLQFSFEASSMLARKIHEGAQFDAFLSADQETVDQIQADLDAATITPFLSNRLALVHRAGLEKPVAEPRGLVGTEEKIAVAGPAVPAGKYIRAYLAKVGILDALAPRLAHADSVRSALALVESGAADYAFVYETDAAVARKAKLVWTDTAGVAPKVRYVAAVVKRPTTTAAAEYVAFLKTAPFQEAARAKGFVAP